MKVERCVANLHNKIEFLIHIRNLKQDLNHRLVLKKVHRVIKFNPYIDMNADLRKAAKNTFVNNFSKLINNSVFWKTMEDVRI